MKKCQTIPLTKQLIIDKGIINMNNINSSITEGYHQATIVKAEHGGLVNTSEGFLQSILITFLTDDGCKITSSIPMYKDYYLLEQLVSATVDRTDRHAFYSSEVIGYDTNGIFYFSDFIGFFCAIDVEIHYNDNTPVATVINIYPDIN